MKTVIDELDSYICGWLGYFKLSSTYTEVLGMLQWVRRRVSLYYWKQWKQPRTRHRNLLELGADPKTVHMATRSRKGYWREDKAPKRNARGAKNLALIRNALLEVIPFEEFESLNDAFDYYRDRREKSVKLITTARPVQE